jgi:hypothetical protein
MKKTILLLFAIILSLSIFAGGKKVNITTSADARIFVNGKDVASGATTIEVQKGAEVKVRVVKPGYITMDRVYIDNGTIKLPKADFFDLQKDPAFDASEGAETANRDIDITTNKTEDEAWRLLTQIVTGAFDVIEVNDKNSGYLRTAWTTKKFGAGSTVRTRLVVKLGNSNPLSYKVKILSEKAPAGTSSTDDEKWESWDRLLKVYSGMIQELQSRMIK